MRIPEEYDVLASIHGMSTGHIVLQYSHRRAGIDSHLRTYLVDAATGGGALISNDLPSIKFIGQERYIATFSDPYPRLGGASDGMERVGRQEAVMRYRTPTTILTTLAALACSSDQDSNGTETRKPVETIGELSTADPLWRVAPEPTLVLGELEGPDAYLFSQIRGATRLSTGTVVVLDGASSQLRAFSAVGAHLWTAGGPGEGPGEMRNPTHLETLPGDTLQVQDGLSRIRYAADGTLIAHERLATADLQEFGRYYASECAVPSFVGDHVLACSGGFDATQPPREEGPWRGETELALLPWSLDSIAHLGVFLKEVGWAMPFEAPPRLPERLVVWGGRDGICLPAHVPEGDLRGGRMAAEAGGGGWLGGRGTDLRPCRRPGAPRSDHPHPECSSASHRG